LERAIVQAVTDRAYRVAEILADQLKARQEARVPSNVVSMAARRGDRT
jgi:hypothetical protein